MIDHRAPGPWPWPEDRSFREELRFCCALPLNFDALYRLREVESPVLSPLMVMDSVENSDQGRGFAHEVHRNQTRVWGLYLRLWLHQGSQVVTMAERDPGFASDDPAPLIHRVHAGGDPIPRASATRSEATRVEDTLICEVVNREHEWRARAVCVASARISSGSRHKTYSASRAHVFSGSPRPVVAARLSAALTEKNAKRSGSCPDSHNLRRHRDTLQELK